MRPQLIRRRQRRNQPDAMRLPRVNQPPAQQDIRRVPRPHQVQQPPHLAIPHQYPQPRYRYAKRTALRRDANIRSHRQLASAAHAEPSYHRDSRLRHRLHRVHSAIKGVRVNLSDARIAAVLLKVLNIRARRERLIPRPRQRHHAHRIIPLQLNRDPPQLQPPRITNRIAPLRPIKHHRRHAPISLHQYIIAHPTKPRLSLLPYMPMPRPRP